MPSTRTSVRSPMLFTSSCHMVSMSTVMFSEPPSSRKSSRASYDPNWKIPAPASQYSPVAYRRKSDWLLDFHKKSGQPHIPAANQNHRAHCGSCEEPVGSFDGQNYDGLLRSRFLSNYRDIGVCRQTVHVLNLLADTMTRFLFAESCRAG